MKIFLPLLLLLSAAAPSLAQRNNFTVLWPEDPRTHRYAFNGSGYQAEATQDDLYNRAKQFFERTFISEKDTIVANEKDKTVVCKGAFLFPPAKTGDKERGYLTFTFTIKCSKRFYRYSLTNFEHIALNPGEPAGGYLENEVPTSGGWLFPVHYWNTLKAMSYYRIANTIERMKQAMAKESAE